MRHASSSPRQSQPPELIQDLIRRRAQRILFNLREPTGTPSASPDPPIEAESEAAWSLRYTEAAKRYEGLDLCSQEAIDAIVGGLQAWVSITPQRSFAADGTPEPANKWGLGAERCVLRALQSHLVAVGHSLLAARINSEMADLIQTAESLDECCMQALPDPHAEKRLVATARIQTKALVKLLAAVQLECSRYVTNDTPSGRKRGHPPSQAPGRDHRLMEEWAQVRGKAGTTRKEFCAAKGISLQAFIQAQDRFRKQTAQSAAMTEAQTPT